MIVMSAEHCILFPKWFLSFKRDFKCQVFTLICSSKMLCTKHRIRHLIGPAGVRLSHSEKLRSKCHLEYF